MGSFNPMIFSCSLSSLQVRVVPALGNPVRITELGTAEILSPSAVNHFFRKVFRFVIMRSNIALIQKNSILTNIFFEVV
jgi:hypothetical protein